MKKATEIMNMESPHNRLQRRLLEESGCGADTFEKDEKVEKGAPLDVATDIGHRAASGVALRSDKDGELTCSGLGVHGSGRILCCGTDSCRYRYVAYAVTLCWLVAFKNIAARRYYMSGFFPRESLSQAVCTMNAGTATENLSEFDPNCPCMWFSVVLVLLF
eukprot:scaffold22592_cov129-Cylindrotheca_fusiformis.AAC.34